jgi:uncharacterized protein (TIGR03435 family)
MPTISIAALKSCTICLLLVTLSMIANLRAVLGQESLVQDSAAVGSGSPRFEVASIRPHSPGYWPTFDLFRFTPDGFEARNIQVQRLIINAYDLQDPNLGFQGNLLRGAPNWVQSDWYDIEAKMSGYDIARLSKLSIKQKDTEERQMLQTLLEERFRLAVHIDTKDAPAYILALAKNGPKNMRKSSDDAKPKVTHTILERGERRTEYVATPLSVVIARLKGQLTCPVIDKTGLTGNYDFVLDWWLDPETMPPSQPGDPRPPNPAGPTIASAVQEQLGLKLVRVTAAMKTPLCHSH